MTRWTRVLPLARVVLGATMVRSPRRCLEVVTGRRSAGAWHELVCRVLGARDLAQGVVTAVFPRRSVWLGGAAVDALHALSMLGVAALRPADRRPALCSAALAGSFAAVEIVAASGPDRTP